MGGGHCTSRSRLEGMAVRTLMEIECGFLEGETHEL